MVPENEPTLSAEGAALPGVYVDSFVISYSANRMRISFSEYLDGTEHYRSAVVMPLDDAAALAHAILEALDEMATRKEA